MTAGLSLDLAKAATLLRAAYADEERGDDPLPNFLRSRAVIHECDLSEALGLALDALVRMAWDEPEEIARALCLDGEHHGELEADLDAFATGAEQ